MDGPLNAQNVYDGLNLRRLKCSFQSAFIQRVFLQNVPDLRVFKLCEFFISSSFMISMNNGLPGAMVMCVVVGVVGGEEEAFIRSVSCQTSQQLLPSLPPSLPTKYLFSSSAKSQFRRLALDLPFPERKVEEVSNVCGSPGHDVTGIEGGAS